MTNEEKAREIYLTILVEHNGWDRKEAEQAFEEDGEFDPLYQNILNTIEE